MISVEIADDMLAVFLLGVMTAVVIGKSSPFLYWIYQKIQKLIAKYKFIHEQKIQAEISSWQEDTNLCSKCGTKLDPYTTFLDEEMKGGFTGTWIVGRQCPNDDCGSLWRSKSAMSKNDAENFLKEITERKKND